MNVYALSFCLLLFAHAGAAQDELPPSVGLKAEAAIQFELLMPPRQLPLGNGAQGKEAEAALSRAKQLCHLGSLDLMQRVCKQYKLAHHWACSPRQAAVLLGQCVEICPTSQPNHFVIKLRGLEPELAHSLAKAILRTYEQLRVERERAEHRQALGQLFVLFCECARRRTCEEGIFRNLTLLHELQAHYNLYTHAKRRAIIIKDARS